MESQMESRIERRRRKLGITQEALIARVGIAKKSLYNYVHGRAIPSDVLAAIANGLRCSADYLLGIKNYTAITVVREGTNEVIASVGFENIICKDGYTVIFSEDST